MNWNKELITPSMAEKYLATRDEAHQRKYRESLARNYALTMHNGDWGLTHQGIAFDEKGRLIDGQHRMGGIILSGTTQEFWVCKAVPEKQGKIFTLDQVDRGSTRTVGEQLKIRHGYKNGNAIATAARFIGIMLSDGRGPGNSRIDVARTLAILDIYGADAAHVLNKLLSSKAVRLWRRGAVYAPLIVARHVAAAQTDAFCEQIASGEGLKSGSPAHTLFRWRCGEGLKAASQTLINAVAIAMRKHYEGASLKIINSSSRYGVSFWLDTQPRNVQRVRSLFSME